LVVRATVVDGFGQVGLLRFQFGERAEN